MTQPPRAAALVGEMERAINGAPAQERTGLAGLVAELAGSNLRQWDLEDATRDVDAGDRAVANAKRSIDRLNVSRHRIVEQIDRAITAGLDLPDAAPLATESPGMVIDRLSVLVIRRARTREAASRDGTYAERLPVLDRQVASLMEALDGYLQELWSGTRRFVAYEHLKLYNGPKA